MKDKKIAFAIHGGAGTVSRTKMSPTKEKRYLRALEEALLEGYLVLQRGGTSLAAVTKAITILEDNPLFNAGKGSVFNHNKEHEMDAAIMDGKNKKAGAVACVQGVKNPIILAKKVMQNSKHVLLSGDEALEFAKEQGIKLEEPDYFFDRFRLAQWKKAQKSNSVTLDHSDDKKFGTVGAVALDFKGNLAAGTSTGGMTNKRYGRIGDSPLIGCGTFADNNTCAVSCTGHGEFFIRQVVAHDIAAQMKYANLSLKQACDNTVMKSLKKLGGKGGVIAIDKQGNISLTFNSKGMYRASISNDNEKFIGIF